MIRYDEKGHAICSGCGMVMTKITREDKEPKIQWCCPDQECGKCFPLYEQRKDEQ